MIDSMLAEIPVENFQPLQNFEKGEDHLVESKVIYQKYKLFNASRSHYLSLRYIPKRRVLQILYSWRKWYFGPCNLRDFTIEEFLHCIELLAYKLNISKEVLLNESKIKHFEFGKNIKTQQSPSEFLNSSKTLSTYLRSEFKNSSVKFLGNCQSITLYDKLREMVNNKNQKLPIETAALFRNSGNYFIRYEIEIVTSNLHKTDYKGKEINTILDLIDNYPLLLQYWQNMFDKIIFASDSKKIIDTEMNKIKSTKKFNSLIYAYGMLNWGVKNVLDALKLSNIPHPSKTAIRKKINETNNMFQADETFYSLELFREKISKTVKREYLLWEQIQSRNINISKRSL